MVFFTKYITITKRANKIVLLATEAPPDVPNPTTTDLVWLSNIIATPDPLRPKAIILESTRGFGSAISCNWWKYGRESLKAQGKREIVLIGTALLGDQQLGINYPAGTVF